MTKTIMTVGAIALLAIFCLVVAAPAVMAQAPSQSTTPETPQQAIKTIGDTSGLQKGTVASFVSNIIKWILGIIGIILVAMFVYGGVMYATSAGNDERVETGKKIMIYAVIGVAIIAVAFIASDYIIKALIPETAQNAR